MRKTDKFTFFWGQSDVFSQWHRSDFAVDGISYVCMEQFMMAEKARLFGDADAERSILATHAPDAHKKLGKKVKNFVEDVWLSHREGIISRGNIAKFSQNRSLLKALMDTKGTRLVEASPYDRIYGIGMRENDARASDPEQWEGMNLLGNILTSLRDDYFAGTTDLLQYRVGSMFEGVQPGTILLHACNCKGRWGSGVAATFAKKYPEAEAEHRTFCELYSGDPSAIRGQHQILLSDKPGVQIGVLFTSTGYGKDVDPPHTIAEATAHAFGLFCEEALTMARGADMLVEVRMPKINSGLFRVPWDVSERVLKEVLSTMPEGWQNFLRFAVYTL